MSNRILFLAPWYWDRQDPDQAEPILPASLIKQTHKDWELLMLYDGEKIPPDALGMWNLDNRVTYEPGGPRKGYWGHPLRQKMIQRVIDDEIECDFIVHTNPDDYYMPGFCETMLRCFRPEIQVVICDMSNRANGWRPIPCKVDQGWVKAGNFMMRRDVALEVGWPTIRKESEWDMIVRVAERYPTQMAGSPMNLFVHN